MQGAKELEKVKVREIQDASGVSRSGPKTLANASPEPSRLPFGTSNNFDVMRPVVVHGCKTDVPGPTKHGAFTKVGDSRGHGPCCGICYGAPYPLPGSSGKTPAHPSRLDLCGALCGTID